MRLRIRTLGTQTFDGSEQMTKHRGSTMITRIRPGVTNADALEHAACVLRGLRTVVGGGVPAGGLDADACYLVDTTLGSLAAIVDGLMAPERQAA